VQASGKLMMAARATSWLRDEEAAIQIRPPGQVRCGAVKSRAFAIR
jgi:hypothetical protein